MFEKAVREKFRFAYKGSITVEDLWDLTVEALDGIYRALRGEQKERSEDTLLVTKADRGADVLACKIDIVRHIVGVKLAEAEQRKAAADRRAQKARIMEIIEQKQDAALASKSVDELQALLSGL